MVASGQTGDKLVVSVLYVELHIVPTERLGHVLQPKVAYQKLTATVHLLRLADLWLT